jgi:hypothetical protein
MTGVASRQQPDVPAAPRQWHGQEHSIELSGVGYRLRLFGFAAGWLASVDTVEGPTLGCNRSPYLAVSRAVEPIGAGLDDAMSIVAALRLTNRAFGSNEDYAQLIKQYGVEHSEDANPTARRYSPNTVTGQEVRIINGDPDPDLISTSYVERNNLTMRMSMRRFTRLTNGFSKKVENHAAAVALYTMHYNFARTHKSIANPYARTPAMAAGIADHVWTYEEMAGLLD